MTYLFGDHMVYTPALMQCPYKSSRSAAAPPHIRLPVGCGLPGRGGGGGGGNAPRPHQYPLLLGIILVFYLYIIVYSFSVFSLYETIIP